MRRSSILALLILTVPGYAQAPQPAEAGGHLVNVGDHRIYMKCSGPATHPTVVLETGAGATTTSYEQVQERVQRFARVCSYDRAGLGSSDPSPSKQTENDVLQDLHRALLASKEPGPYVLVGESLGGVYVRAFQTRYPALVKGLVLVDSSHEEQLNRFSAVSPELGKAYAAQGGRTTFEDMYGLWGQLRPGQTYTWKVTLPLIVIEHKRPSPVADPNASRPNAAQPNIDPVWHEMQVDLARRSTCGQIWEATKEGHAISEVQPDLVVQAISTVLQEIASGCERPAPR